MMSKFYYQVSGEFLLILFVDEFQFWTVQIGHVNNIPKMHFFSGIHRNTQAKSYMLSLTVCVRISKIMHCGILINMPYWTISCLGQHLRWYE